MLNKIALAILIFGGINWGLIGIFQFDSIAWIFGGQDSLISRITYTLIAVSAIWCVSLYFKDKINIYTKKN